MAVSHELHRDRARHHGAVGMGATTAEEAPASGRLRSAHANALGRQETRPRRHGASGTGILPHEANNGAGGKGNISYKKREKRMKKTSEYLKYVFTEDETKSFARELARENTAAAEVEEQKKAVMASFAEKLTASKSKISMLSRYINNGYDYRTIDCEIVMDTPSTGFKTIVRLDTGEEVKTLPMLQSEMQAELPLQPEAQA